MTMATITEDYVSFEVAKLLKEKGFDIETIKYWENEGGQSTIPSICELSEPYSNSYLGTYEYSCPSLYMAMKWLRKEHKLHIWIDYSSFDFNDKLPYLWNIRETKIEGTYFGGTYHKSCEEAEEVAIKYCLINLI